MKATQYYDELNSFIGYVRFTKDHEKIFAREINKLSKLIDLENASVLDVGCGNGIHLKPFVKKKIISYTGIDYSEKMLIACTLEHINSKSEIGFDLQKVDLEKGVLPFNAKSFDVVFSRAVLTYVKNSEEIINEMHRVVKPNGFIFLEIMTHKEKTLKSKRVKHDVDCFLFSQNKIKKIFKKLKIKVIQQKTSKHPENGFIEKYTLQKK